MTEHSRPLAAVLHPDKKLPAYRVILSHPVCGQLVFSDFTRFWGLFCHDLVGQSVESPRHYRGVAPDIELQNTQFSGVPDAASGAAKQQKGKKIP